MQEVFRNETVFLVYRTFLEGSVFRYVFDE